MLGFVRLAAGLALLAFVVTTPFVYRHFQVKHFRNLRVVQPDVLYRSGQLDLYGLRRLVDDLGIKTVVNLREGDAKNDRDEERWVVQHGLRFFRIPPRKWHGDHGEVPAEVGLAEFRKVMDDPSNHPVLLHCYAGIHRTGAYVAIYRMDYQGWSNWEAITEMQAMGYTTIADDEDIFTYMCTRKPLMRVSQR